MALKPLTTTQVKETTMTQDEIKAKAKLVREVKTDRAGSKYIEWNIYDVDGKAAIQITAQSHVSNGFGTHHEGEEFNLAKVSLWSCDGVESRDDALFVRGTVSNNTSSNRIVILNSALSETEEALGTYNSYYGTKIIPAKRKRGRRAKVKPEKSYSRKEAWAHIKAVFPKAKAILPYKRFSSGINSWVVLDEEYLESIRYCNSTNKYLGIDGGLQLVDMNINYKGSIRNSIYPIKPESVKQSFKLNSYDVEVSEDRINVGCNTFMLDDINKLIKFIKTQTK